MPVVELTLVRQGSHLAETAEQCRILQATPDLPDFASLAGSPLAATGLEVLQINVGKVCNQTCRHCHVDAGPDRRESMSREVASACLRLLAGSDIPTLDITGGAPEMNPHFRWLVQEARQLGRQVIDRCNLTILTAPGFDDLPQFLAEQQVQVVASLPCYLEENVDRQRGSHVFERSLQALRRLNGLGYGMPGSDLELTLVFNPVGPTLPPSQDRLEADYRRELRSRYGIEFTRLFTITNMPISRFLDDLLRSGQYETYMHKLVAAYNPATLGQLMCRTMVSVDWQGRLFDCDFNQMLELGLAPGQPRSILDLDADSLASLIRRPIVTGQHCFGCTAGAGSSCQGSIQADAAR
ncbi:MAG: arsenosugar biosynthesis radical SAM (seleno)protein ArsS [Pirellulales bacterium]